MPNVSLIGGLLQGFSDVGLKKQDQKHQDEMEARRERLAMLLNIDPMGLNEKGQQTLAGLLDEAYGGSKGGKNGKGGQPGPFSQLFSKIGPMLAGGKKRPDGLASPVPQGLNYGGQRQPTELDQVNPQVPTSRVTNAADYLRGAPPQSLESVPRPTEAPASVPQNVPRGTIHPGTEAGAGPMTLGQLYVSQNRGRAEQSQMDQRMAQYDNFRKQWEAKYGPLTKEQEQELMEHAAGLPAGFSRAGKDEIIRNVAGPEPGVAYTQIRHPDGTTELIKEVAPPKAPGAGPKPTALQQKRDQEIADRRAATGESLEQATKAVAVAHYTDTVQTRLTNRFRGEIAENNAKEAANRLVSGTPTVKDARFVLRDAIAEAKERMANALRQAKGGWVETGGQPGPDNGKTEDQLVNEILQGYLGDGEGFNPDEVRKLAAGSVPRQAKPKRQGAVPGGTANDPAGILD